jgi:hypothetical protein
MVYPSTGRVAYVMRVWALELDELKSSGRLAHQTS